MDLVTGATGFIGKRLLARLLYEGREVRALLRQEALVSQGAPQPELFSTATSVFVLFAVSLAVSALAICWALRVAYKASASAQPTETPRPKGQTPATHFSEGASS